MALALMMALPGCSPQTPAVPASPAVAPTTVPGTHAASPTPKALPTKVPIRPGMRVVTATDGSCRMAVPKGWAEEGGGAQSLSLENPPHTYYLVSSLAYGARGPAQEQAVRDLLLTFRTNRP
ncbi:hypothetical protein AB0L05_02335 [Nonomuraea pusilla]|uniref:hypothetical protein n=1 Tax=Nonomuraea pusilla TaxID=46177 RepID=UPI003325768D